MDNTNLFRWATSELSQDAFICWLMSFALKENQGKNKALEDCALKILHQIPDLENALEISYIERQSHYIDVLLTVGDYYVIIEDKVFTGVREGQIASYKQALMSDNIPPEKIKTVLYTISIQPQNDAGFDCVFTLEKLLEVMRPYKSVSNSDVFSYYVEYLEEVAKGLQFDKLPISEWYGETYKAFFEHLRKEGLVSEDYEYNYVSNPNGGFMGVWWNFRGKEIDPSGNYLRHVYMQISKNKASENLVSVRMSVPEGEYDKDRVKTARQKIYDYFLQSHLSDELQKKWHWGNSMAVCYITYDERNYREQITKMQKVFDDMLKELRF